MVEGETLLTEANQIDVLAALNNGATRVNDIDGFSVGTVVADAVSADRAMVAMNGTIDAAAMSVTGVTTSGDDVKLTSDGNLSVDEAINLVGGNLFLDVNGDVSQSTTGTINAAGLGLMVDGETVLNEANDIDVLAANNNGITRINDIDDLTVGIVTVEAVSADRAMTAMNGTVDAAAMSITGVTTSNDDVKLTAAGDVALLQAVDVGAGELFLDVNGNVTQSIDGTINADGLGLTVVGDVFLNNIANNTNNLAADVVGTLNYSDTDGFTIASLECDGIVISGITTTVDLNVITSDGSVFQDDDAPLTIGGDTSFSTGAGDICLTNVNNIFDGEISLITTGEVVLATSGDLNITSTIVAGGGSLRFIADMITVSTDIVANQLLLQASSGIELVDTFTIDVTDLLLSGTGNFDLVNTGGNLIDNLAVDVDGDVMINNLTALNIGSLTFVSDCGDVAISGVNVDAGFGGAGDFEVTTVDSDVTQSAAITVEGTTTVDAGTGNVKLNGADRGFERTGTTDDTTDASSTGDGLNDNDFNRVEATGSEVEIIDVNDLEAGDINAVDNIFLRAGDTSLTTGQLTLDGDLTTTAADGQVLLQSDTEISQNTGSVISSNDLLVGSASEAEFQASNVDLDGDNQVNNLAVRLTNNFRLVNAIDLKVSTVNYVSSCTTELHAGIDVTGDVTLVVDGNLTLEQATSVSDNLLLDAQGDVSQLATGAITATGLALQVVGTTVLNDATNNVAQIAALNDGATQFTDSNDLIVGSVGTVHSAGLVDGITTSNDDVKLTVAGNLTLEETVNLGEGDLFLDVNGDVSQLATGTIDAAGLGLMVEGETVLNEANDIDVLAADNNGATQVNDINDLKVGTVTAEAVSADRAMAAMNGTVDAAAMSITGVTTSDDDVKLTAEGNLTLEEAVNAGEGDLILDVDGDVSQLTAGTIDAAGLGLMVEGETVLNEANDIDVLAADNNGAAQVNDINDLKVGTVTAEAVAADRAMAMLNGQIVAAETSITGVTTSNDDVKLTADGNITLEEAVNLGEGDLFLDVDGDVSQIAAGTIDAAGLGLMVEGDTVLNEANDIDVLAADNNGATQVNDINDLKVGTVTAEAVSADRAMAAMNGTIDAAAMSLTGVTTSDDDVKLTANGNLTLEETVNLGEGDLILDANGDVSQIAAGTIDAAGLGLMVEGETILNEANDIDVLATNNNGATQVNDINDLKVGTVTAEAVSADRAMTAMNGTIDAAATTLTGITTSDDDVKLTVEGNLTLEEAVNVGEGDLFLDVNGDVSQIAAGTIDAAGLGLMVEGETVLNEANDIDVLAADNNGATQLNDITDLKIGTVTAEAVSADRAMTAMNGTIDAAEMSITGVTTSDDDVKLTAESNVTLEEAVDVGEGDLFLDVNGDVSQLAAGTIDAAGLGLMVEGETVLNEANDIDVLATDNNGATQVSDINDLKVGTVTAEAVSTDRAMAAMNGTIDAAAMSITGVTTSDDDVKLTAAGNLTLEEAVDLDEGRSGP